MKDKEFKVKLTEYEIKRILNCMQFRRISESEEFEEDVYFESAYKKLLEKIIKNK